MKKIIIFAGTMSVFSLNAQELDSVNEKNIDEIILNRISKKDTESSNKMPIKFIENSQVYSSVDKSVLEHQNIFTVDEAFRNVTGLQKMWNATNRSGDGGAYINLRGFIASNGMRNGMVSPVSGTIDAINIEKLEVLKGPSGTIFGSNVSSYGGIVNRVTKKPFDYFKGSATVAGGSYDYYRAQADINAPLNKSKSLLFRINTAYTTEGNFQNKDVHNTYFAFIPSLTWKISDNVDLNVEYEAFENRNQGEQGLFFIFSPSKYGFKDMQDLENAGLNYKESYVGKDLYNTGRNRNLFGQLNYRINDKIKSTTLVSSSYSYSNGFNPYFYLTTASYAPDGTPLGLYRGDQSTRDSKQTYLQLQQNFNFDFNIGTMRNRLLAGADYLKNKSNQLFIFGILDFVPFTRNYDYTGFNGQTVGDFYNSEAAGNYPDIGEKNTYSAYVSDVLTIADGLNVMASIRYESNDFQGGKKGANEIQPYQQSAFSPKFGLVYEIVKNKFSAFGNYQNSFKSNGYYLSDASENVSLSDPETANQYEVGFKTNLLNSRLNATISYYDIKVKNTLQTIGYTTSSLAIQNQAGELKSKGVELEVNAYLVKGFSVIAGLSYNDSKYTETSDASVLNRRPNTASSPWLANFNANYQFLDGTLKGLGFGFGGNYASANRIFNTTTDVFELPKYFVLNGNAFYDTPKYRIAVNVDNFTNEHYWIGYTTANAQKLLNAVASFTYKF
ncbi:TonB-dependent siderophore receptor [Kaistella montana]|uniref:TonB-dependent siderophore receptor n=1 Tax=Kaistella montana TaxID=1849733 RepID=A0ABW5K9Y6_9FLAO|nr:TonB-dependent receptor [Kaistella montana]MCQ4035296.1 TonB-dependent receptor [Kaistella montana]